MWRLGCLPRHPAMCELVGKANRFLLLGFPPTHADPSAVTVVGALPSPQPTRRGEQRL
jgi:hypothetical protein